MNKVKRINGHGHHELDFLDTPENLFPFVSKYIHKNVGKNGKRVQNLLNTLNRVVPGEKLRYLSPYLNTIDNTDEERLQENLQYHDMVFSICVDLHYMGAENLIKDKKENKIGTFVVNLAATSTVAAAILSFFAYIKNNLG